MRIRPCREADLPALLDVFYRTVHTACAGDYTPAQLSAWAPETPDTARWAEKLRQETFLAAEGGGALLGFGALEGAYLDLLYVARLPGPGSGLRAVRLSGAPLPRKPHHRPRFPHRPAFF